MYKDILGVLTQICEEAGSQAVRVDILLSHWQRGGLNETGLFPYRKFKHSFYKLYQLLVAAVTNHQSLVAQNDENVSLIVLEARSWKSISGVKSRVLHFMEFWGGSVSHHFLLWWPLVSQSLRLHHSYLCLYGYPAFSPVCGKVSLCLPHTRIHVTAFMTHSDSSGQFPHLRIFNLLTSEIPFLVA